MPSASQRGSSRLSTTTSATQSPNPSSPNPDSSSGANKPASISSASSSSRSGFLSRLSLPPINIPLRSRNRNLADFHIRPDEPHKQYNAGDSVRGSVVLAVVKPLRITHLVVSLHGYVQVYKDPAAAARGQIATLPPRGGISTRPQYHGGGIATLFQDEQVLSGEGRLEPGRYEFGFDLVFPKRNLPSSIDFERGTVSYMITATLTRPTTIAPTTSCDRRVTLAERIDIGHLRPPRPRTIFLEPMAKKSRKKRNNNNNSSNSNTGLERTATASQESAGTEVGSEVDSTEHSLATDDSSRDYQQVEGRNGVDVRSEISGGSSRSVSTGMSRYDFAQTATTGITSPAKQQVVDNKTITATIEMLKSGYLAGDTINVRISVQHIKRVKSMSGVIVTLYRQARIDSSPPAGSFTGRGGGIIDEAYPTSRTSLAGLALTSASSRSVFRKDLDQNTAPLIIDPATLYATMKLSLKIPDDSFPTIKSVPGGMISFKYMVEVIVDLGGRLSSQILQVTQPSGRLGQHYGGSEPSVNAYGPRMAPGSILDTTPLRPQKGVISVSMETIIGTVDVSRVRKPVEPGRRIIRLADGEEVEVVSPNANNHQNSATANGASSMYTDSQQPRYPSPPPPLPPLRIPEHAVPGPSQPSYPQANGHHQHRTAEAAPAYIPRPEIPDQNNMTEKERVRAAETRLLPSQPPGAESSSSATAEEEDLYESQDTPRPPYAAPSFPPIDGESEAGPSAPTEDDMVSSSAFPAEDKQELERRRLIDEASAPPEVPDDIERPSESSSGASGATDVEPSAPVLDDEDDYGSYGLDAAGPSGSNGNGNAGNSSDSQHEQLPAYQR